MLEARLVDIDELCSMFEKECIGECACCVYAKEDLVCGLIEKAPAIRFECVEGDPFQWRPIDEIKIKDNTIRKLKVRLNMLEDRLDASRSQLKQMRQEKNAAVGYLKRALVCEACNNFDSNRLTEPCSHCSKINVDGFGNKFDWKWPCVGRGEKENGKGQAN